MGNIVICRAYELDMGCYTMDAAGQWRRVDGISSLYEDHEVAIWFQGSDAPYCVDMETRVPVKFKLED